MKSKNKMFAILSDVLLQVVVVFIAICVQYRAKLATSVEIAAQVPHLEQVVQTKEKQVAGLEGTLSSNMQALANKDGQIGELQTTVDAQGATIDGQRTQINGWKDAYDRQGEEFRQFQSRLQEGEPVTIVLMPDVTSSMDEPLEALRSAMALLVELMPQQSSDFRVGVVAFRNGVVAEYPVTPILPKYRDDGKSQQGVLAFLDTLQPERGHTNHLPAFKRAVEMLHEAHPTAEKDRKEIVTFLGDVGPSEIDAKTGYTESERKTKDILLSGMQKWAAYPDRRRSIISLYSESEFSRSDPGREETLAWFKALGSVSDSSAFYTDSNELLRAIRRAAEIE